MNKMAKFVTIRLESYAFRAIDIDLLVVYIKLSKPL